MKKTLYAIVFILYFLITPTKAADINSYNGVIFINGQITHGDYQYFLNTIENNHIKLVILSSPGGVAYEGIKIAELVRNRRMDTAVLENFSCYSICAIIWASGINKYATLPYSDIGFHAIYDSRTYSEKGSANAILGAMLADFGYSREAIYFMTDATPRNLNRLTIREAYNYGISYIELNRSNYIINNSTASNLSGYEVVKGFYHALSIADGDLAAAYIIPEKRGVGPFNQTNIYKFYSSLRNPLKVDSITQINPNQFQVDYQYTLTKTHCKTSATVTTRIQNGYTLIEAIKAKC